MAVIGGIHGVADGVSHIAIGSRIKVLDKMATRPARGASQRVSTWTATAEYGECSEKRGVDESE